jgi:MFS family permease
MAAFLLRGQFPVSAAWDATVVATSDRGQSFRLTITCGLLELMSWGSLYYTVPVLHEQMAVASGLGAHWLSFSYSAALVVAALLGPLVGRVIDQQGPRKLVVHGVVLGSMGLTAVAHSTHPLVHLGGMLLVGLAQAATLYPPIFAALTIWLGPDRVPALTVVALFGGASSTVFAPVLAPLAEELDWRRALLAVALAYLAVALPLAGFGLRGPWPGTSPTAARRWPTVSVTRTRRFRALQISMALSGLGLYAMTLNLVSLVVESGHSYRFAASVFALVGVGQVAGRLIYLPLARHGSPRTQTTTQVALSGVSVIALGAAASHPALLIVTATAAGAVRGTHTLAMTTGVSDRWGTVGFGSLSGRFNLPVALAIAAAPFLGSCVASWSGGYASASYWFGSAALLGLLIARRT